MTPDPVRLNLPSASSFALDALCPGRQQLFQEVGDIPEPVDEDANRGTSLHAAWEMHGTPNLHLFEDPEDTEIFEKGVKLVEQVKADWQNFHTDLSPTVEGTREERFFLHNSKGEVAASGQADRHYIAGRFGLVIDFKSLWCKSLAPSELNWQARLLSVLVAREYGLSHTRFAFLKAMLNKADIVDYGEEDLKRAEYSIQQVLWESNQKGAPRRAGAHCRHCKAAAACPEAAAWTTLPTSQLANNGVGITPTLAEEIVGQISLLDCVRVWESSTSRHNIEKAIQTRLKALPEPTLAELGIILGKPKILTPITDPKGAYGFLTEVGIPADRMWAAIKFQNGELTDVVRTSLGLTEKAAKQWIKDKLAPFITQQETDRPLEKL